MNYRLKFFLPHKIKNYPDTKVKYLHPTDEREAREEPHGASDGGQLVHQLGCSVLKIFYEVITI